jgi:hypothetical protein
MSRVEPRSPHLSEVGAPRFDVTSLVTMWLVLLYGISAGQVVPGFGAIGSPALLAALGMFLLWLSGFLLPESGLSRDRHPLRPALFVYLALVILSFAVAMSRSLTELETTGAYRALLTGIAMVGLALVVADGIYDQRRLNTMLRRLVVAGAFLSIVAILQFLTGRPLQVNVPGLVWNADVGGVGARSIFFRPAATAMHAIEFSVVTASLLPLGIHYALHAETLRQRRNMATATVLIGFAMPLAISRSGIVSVVVALAVLAAGWGWRRRMNGFLIALAVVPVMWAVVPGLVGTFVSLFGDSEYDPSIQARIERGPMVMALVRQRPWFGLGNGTFSVEEYFLLDNQIRALMLETGLIGMAVTVLVLLSAVLAGLIIARLATVDRDSAHLGQALAASVAGLSVSLFTFDAFFYRILTGTLFLLLGAVGALWRLNRVSERLFPTQRSRADRRPAVLDGSSPERSPSRN